MPDFAERRRMMVDNQIRTADVTSFPIIDAMLTVPREDFVPTGRSEAAYVGENIALGDGRVMLDPRTLAKMLQAMEIEPRDLVLDVGCGHGYSAAILSRLGEAVVALEEGADMARDATANLAEVGADNVAVIEGPLAGGSAKHGPFDAICIEGGVQVLPDALLDQLNDGGRIACLFMDGDLGQCRIGHRIGGRMNWRFAFNAGAPVLPGFARQPVFEF